MRKSHIAIIDYSLRKQVVDRVWWYRRDGYAVAWFTQPEGGRKTIAMHRYIYALVNGPIPKGMVIDHINGDKLDNRIHNLRCVTQRVNSWNLRCHREGRVLYKTKGKNPRYRGVAWFNHRSYNVGTFDTVAELEEARKKKLAELRAKEREG